MPSMRDEFLDAVSNMRDRATVRKNELLREITAMNRRKADIDEELADIENMLGRSTASIVYAPAPQESKALHSEV